MRGIKKILIAVLVVAVVAAVVGAAIVLTRAGKEDQKNKTAMNRTESTEIENDTTSESSASTVSTPVPTESGMETLTPAATSTPESTPTDTIASESLPVETEETDPATDPGNGRVVGGPWASEGGEGQEAANGHIIVIDPGHQAQGDSNQEPVGPGSSETKARVSSGTSGCVSGLDEYELNLQVSQLLKTELENRGYTVYMTRETHDVNISNKERAEYAASVGGEILVRIHASGSEDSSVSGALCMAPSDSNAYVASLAESSQYLAQCIIDNYCAVTGFNNQGVYITDEMSGINWATMPVTIVEMGYMTNESDDSKMADSGFESTMVMGIANGIDQYFG